MSANAQGGSVYTFETILKGKPWYVAVTGPYRDKSAAFMAIGKLSPSLRNEKPWPRSVAGIQSDIRTRRPH